MKEFIPVNKVIAKNFAEKLTNGTLYGKTF